MKTTNKPYRNHRNYALAGAGLPMKEIEAPTADAWLASGAIKETSRGEENTYYIDGFEREFFCKNYPKQGGAKQDERLILVINGEQLWTEYGGTEREVLCPSERWAEDLAKMTHAWIATGLAIETTLTRLGFKPCQA